MTLTANTLAEELLALANPEIAAHSQRFFKTAPGEYGAGDTFIGIRTPALRKLAHKYKNLDLNDVIQTLKSPIHEQRLLALFIMVLQYKSSDEGERKVVYEAYLSNTKYINNWDLVDSSGMYIVGAHLYQRDRSILYRLVESNNLWERRIAMFSCFYFIRQNDFGDALAIAKNLLKDEQDLIHKVVGWMLREIGKREIDVERDFLQKHYRVMPRTMLRYAIEKFDESERQAYLRGTA